MAAALSIFGVVFAAVCVWMTVRIVNLRERWAKWMLAGLVGIPAIYVASFGPACWLADRDIASSNRLAAIYSPILTVLSDGDVLWSYGNLYCRD